MTRGWVVPVLRGVAVMLLVALWRPQTAGELAVAMIGFAAVLVPDRAAARLRARSAERLAARREAFARTAAEREYDEGYALLRAERYEASVDVLRRVAAASPRDADVRLHLGEALAALGRHDEAAAVLRQAIVLRPRDAAAHARLGVSLAADGEQFIAVRALREALRLDPRHAEARRALESIQQPAAAGRGARRAAGGRGGTRTTPPAA